MNQHRSIRAFLSFHIIAAVLVSLWLSNWAARSAEAGDNARAPKVLIFGLDGVRTDALKAAAKPNLDALIADGVFLEETRILPERETKNDTISGPGWASILSGVWSDKHGVLDNNCGTFKFQQYPTFLERLKQQRPDAMTVALVTWKPLHQQLLRTADVCRNLKPIGSNNYAAADAQCMKAAVDVLANRDPTAMLVYFGNIDNTGHAKGFHPTVAPYLKAIETADSQVGKIMEAVKARKTFAQENWLVIVTTDHGGQGKDHQRGRRVPEINTVFTILSGPSVDKGRVRESSFLVDVPVTALSHLGIASSEDWQLDGQALISAPSEKSSTTAATK
jgi:predicted AlkP superfamily pyrophosphatase or phosphodiesterase